MSDNQAITIREFFDKKKIKEALEKYAQGQGSDIENFIIEAGMAIEDSDKLRQCLDTQTGQMSLLKAMKSAIRSGLSLDPSKGQAAIIPYNGKITFSIMKNGYIELLLQNPEVKTIVSFVIHPEDDFSYTSGSEGTKWSYTPARNREIKKADGYFVAISMTENREFCHYMTRAEVDHVRSASESKSKAWVENYDAMGIKTVIKQGIRSLYIGGDHVGNAPTAISALISEEYEDQKIGVVDNPVDNSGLSKQLENSRKMEGTTLQVEEPKKGNALF